MSQSELLTPLVAQFPGCCRKATPMEPFFQVRVNMERFQSDLGKKQGIRLSEQKLKKERDTHLDGHKENFADQDHDGDIVG